MKSVWFSAAALSGLMLVGGCVSVPNGPSVMALPGQGKTFNQFNADDAHCRQYAYDRIGGTTAGQAATNAGVSSAIVGTLIGAAAGAAIGGHNGAAVGAGTGLVVGSVAGTGTAQRSAYGTQRQYDNAYVQCMYALGESVPVPGIVASSQQQVQQSAQMPPPAPSGDFIPPPPPGTPPPPPPNH